MLGRISRRTIVHARSPRATAASTYARSDTSFAAVCERRAIPGACTTVTPRISTQTLWPSAVTMIRKKRSGGKARTTSTAAHQRRPRAGGCSPRSRRSAVRPRSTPPSPPRASPTTLRPPQSRRESTSRPSLSSPERIGAVGRRARQPERLRRRVRREERPDQHQHQHDRRAARAPPPPTRSRKAKPLGQISVLKRGTSATTTTSAITLTRM